MELIKWLDELRIHDAASVGDAAAALGELTAAGIMVADGFVLSPYVLRRMLIAAGVDPSRAVPRRGRRRSTAAGPAPRRPD